MPAASAPASGAAMDAHGPSRGGAPLGRGFDAAAAEPGGAGIKPVGLSGASDTSSGQGESSRRLLSPTRASALPPDALERTGPAGL